MSVSCVPNDLAALAKCFKCLSAGTLMEVQTYLLCQITNSGTSGGGGLPTGPQAANTVLAGPTSGAAAAPNFRALVTADLGTTMTPQFARVGIGAAADAVIPLTVIRAGAGNTNIANFNDTTGNPYLTLGTELINAGCFWLYDRGANTFSLSVHGSPPAFIGDSAGHLTVTSVVQSNSGFNVSGQPGITQTFDTGIGNTQITFLGGIATSIT